MTETQRQPVPRIVDGEVETCVAFLDFARTSVLKKLDGLSENEAHRAVLPTGTGAARLVRHLTDGENYWFGSVLAGTGNEPDWDAASSDTRPVAQIAADDRTAVATSNQTVRALGNPETLSVGIVNGEHKTLRWVLAHMTSETARHAGHADVVRELIDGVTGR